MSSLCHQKSGLAIIFRTQFPTILVIFLLVSRICKAHNLMHLSRNELDFRAIPNAIEIKNSLRTMVELYDEFIIRTKDRRQMADASDSPIFIDPNGKIVGGEEADRGRYNYFVNLTSKHGWHICGGSLIAPDVVLSAAHCAKYLDDGNAEINRHNLNDKNEEYETFKITEMVLHPDYTRYNGIRNDVVLIRLSGKASAHLVTLNDDNNIPSSDGDSLTVMGWGSTGEKEPGTHLLREVELKYVSNEACRASEGTFLHKHAYGSYAGLIGDDEMCASDIDDNGNVQDACYGDSGGPLIVKTNSSDMDVVVGLVSWGFECGNPNFPGVYARVSHQIDWIQQTTCNLSRFNPQDFNERSFKCESKPSPSPTLSPTMNPAHLKFVTFQIQLDQYPEEVGWVLLEKTEEDWLETIASPIGMYKGRQNEFVEDIINVVPGKTYKFSISDAYGDGVNINGENTFLFQGPEEAGHLLQSWKGNWGKYQETTFTVPILPERQTGIPSITPTRVPSSTPSDRHTMIPSKKVSIDESHQITMRIRLDDHPEDVSWELRSKNGKKIFATSPDYNDKNKLITELITVAPGHVYMFSIFDARGNGINVTGASVFLYDGKIGQGRLVKKLFSRWREKRRVVFWVPKYSYKRNIGQTCNANHSCRSGRCSWGKCRMTRTR